MPTPPVFYDPKQKRGIYSHRLFFLAKACLFIAVGTFATSLIIRPQLPSVALENPIETSRQAPNIPYKPTVAGVAQEASPAFNIASFTTPNKQQAISKEPPTKVIGFYVNWDENSLTSLKTNIEKIDILIPEWLHLADQNGSISIDDPARMQETLDIIQSQKPNLHIMPLINNFNSDIRNWDQNRLVQTLRNPNSRQTLIQNIYDFVTKNNFSGVSVDFENVPDTDQSNLVLFMQELSKKFRESHLQVSQNIPIDDDSFDAAILGKSSDFIILMAYDENAPGSQAGPVAAQGWFVSSLSKRLLQNPSQKYTVAIGGYGYNWHNNSTDGTDVTFGNALRKIQESSTSLSFDSFSFNPTYSYYDGDGELRKVWFLDAVTAFNQIQASKKLGRPYGYALWRLGSEDPSLWNIIPKRDNLDATAAASLKQLRYGYDIHYQGSGEIIQVTETPKDGLRWIAFDQVSGFITDEAIQQFPESYTVTRWGGTREKKIAITFDDGPDDKYTPKILDILKQHNVPATFFIIGTNASLHQDILQRIINEGNEIGNHTYTHPNINAIAPGQLHVEIDAVERLIESVTGHKSLLFRPPYAEDIEPTTPEQIAPLVETSKMGYYTIGINIDPKDWSRPGSNVIAQTVINEARNGVGNVVLMHDSGGDRTQTLEALPVIIETLQKEGFQFVSISDLLGVSRNEIMPPVGSQEQIVAVANRAVLLLISGFSSFLAVIFIIGIYLGIGRIVFISILAAVQFFFAKREIKSLDTNAYKPNIAVIIPAYNEENVIVKTVTSILMSTYQHIRIILIDDGSTDNTLAVMRQSFNDNSYVTILSQENKGKSSALNLGINNTTEHDEILVTLDADTVFQSNTIEKLIQRFANSDVAAVAGNAKVGNRINILTRWQALEYITSQNLDRRAFEILNCISVVPGSVGAWRRQAVLDAGGFSNDTLAEDADLTFSILRQGHKIVYDDTAIAFTEAPDTVKNFIKQRFRWMFGTLQTAWKHKDVLLKKRYGALGFFAIPNIFIFQIFFTLISPLMDIMLIFSVTWVTWQKSQHPIGFDVHQTLDSILFYYLLFLAVDMLTSIPPFLMERREQLQLLLFLPLQRFFYRQLMYYVAIKTVATAIKGRITRWGKFERKATVRIEALNPQQTKISQMQ